MQILKEVNPHFEDFVFDWNSKIYFLVGGYGSSKSYHVALKIILKLLQEKRTCLVVREVYDTIRDSCFSLFKEICEDMDLLEYVVFLGSPMQMKFRNGSKIVFKGMDKPAKLKSINNISLIWIGGMLRNQVRGIQGASWSSASSNTPSSHDSLEKSRSAF